MKRLLVAFVVIAIAARIWLPWPVVLHAAVAHVQTTMTSHNISATPQTTSSITLTAANNLLLGTAGFNSSGRTITSVKLDATTDFTQSVFLDNGTDTCSIWYLLNIPSGSHTVDVNWSSAISFATEFLTEFSGGATSSATDGTSSAMGASTSAAPGNYGATGTDFFYQMEASVGSTSASVDSSFTIPTNGTEFTNVGTAVAYRANPGSAPQNATFTIDVARFSACGAAFKVAAAVGGNSGLTLLGVGR